jgi:EAL domain-containing protein (putative c-di-GMP-specific phosphodiesterase class I)
MAACRQLAAWEAMLPAGRVPAVAVNVSGRQLDDPACLADVAEALTTFGVQPGRLTLEITETALARDAVSARATLVALRALGVRVAIDDFGTGYSSLGYLQQFPVDVLKIDKRFIDGVASGGSDAALARTIIALATSLGLRTVAEGVEQERQQAALHALGCEFAQGYLFARPMPASDLTPWFVRHAASPATAAAPADHTASQDERQSS